MVYRETTTFIMMNSNTQSPTIQRRIPQLRGEHHRILVLLSMLITTLLLPVHAFVVPPILPSQQQQQQQQYHRDEKSSVPTLTPLYEKKRTKGSGGGFGNVMKDIMSSSSATAPSTFPFTGTVRPGNQSPQRIVVDESIIKPDYWQTGVPSKTKKGLLPWVIEVKTPEEIVKMKEAGVLARHILDLAGRAVRPGITTDEIDTIVHDEIIKVRLDC